MVGWKDMVRKMVRFFDKLEDKVRLRLSRQPIVYALVGGVGIVLFWKGVWETAEYFVILNGPISIVISVILLLMSGLFVSFFIGDQVIISGIKREKKIAEKTEEEVEQESSKLDTITARLEEMDQDLHELKRNGNHKATGRRTTSI